MEFAEQNENKGRALEKKGAGATAQIREVVQKVESKSKYATPGKQVRKVLRVLKKKDKEEIVQAVLEKYYDAEELKPYQAELIKMQRHLERTGKKMVILFDGRDASGKGGTIRRVTRYMNEKRYHAVALGKPNEQQKTELHIKRYIEHFPHAGEVVLFDRSWYNRALVEPVMGFCTQNQYKRFLKKVISYEQNFLEDNGKTILIKIYFSVSKEEQARRFERRKNDPLRQWKLSEVDLQAQEWSTYIGSVVGGEEYPLSILGWFLDFPDAENYTQPWIENGGQGSVVTSYEDNSITPGVNPELLVALDAQRGLTDPAEREAALDELQNIYAEEVVTVPLWVEPEFIVYRDGIAGDPNLPNPEALNIGASMEFIYSLLTDAG